MDCTCIFLIIIIVFIIWRMKRSEGFEPCQLNTSCPVIAMPPPKKPLVIKKFNENDKICSQLHREVTLFNIFNQIGIVNKFFVTCGVRDPDIVNRIQLKIDCDWSGLVIDDYPSDVCDNCEYIKELLSVHQTDKIVFQREHLTKDNINKTLTKYNVPPIFDLLTIDTTGNDAWILNGLDINQYQPRVIVVEFSSYFKGNEWYAPKVGSKDEQQPGDVSGASLGFINVIMRNKNYSYVTHIGGNRAIFVQDDLLVSEDIDKPIPNIIPEGWQYKKRLAKKHNIPKMFMNFASVLDILAF